jgi:hypothetical protein
MGYYGVTDEVFDIKGRQSVSFVLKRRKIRTHVSSVCSLPTDAAGLLGTVFMAKAGTVIDFECGSMALTATPMCPKFIMSHQQGTPHSLYSWKIKDETVFDPPSERRGALTSSSQLAPDTRYKLHRVELG